MLEECGFVACKALGIEEPFLAKSIQECFFVRAEFGVAGNGMEKPVVGLDWGLELDDGIGSKTAPECYSLAHFEFCSSTHFPESCFAVGGFEFWSAVVLIDSGATESFKCDDSSVRP